MSERITAEQVYKKMSLCNEEIILVEKIYDELGLEEGQTKKFIATLVRNIKLFDKKQKDYGPGNIDGFLEFGVLVRTSDKIARLKNLWSNKRLDDSACEAVSDTWDDISNYGAIGRMCRDENW